MTMAGMKRRDPEPILASIGKMIGMTIAFGLLGGGVICVVLWVVGETIEHFTP